MSNLIQHISLDEATTVHSGTVHHFGDTASELKVALETLGKCPNQILSKTTLEMTGAKN